MMGQKFPCAIRFGKESFGLRRMGMGVGVGGILHLEIHV